MDHPSYSIALCRFPGDGSEYHETVTWLIRTVGEMTADRRISKVVPITIAGETPITIARNRAVKQCLDQQIDYILMVDSDMHPDLPGELPFWSTAWDFMYKRRLSEEMLGLTFPEEVVSKKYPPATIAAPYCGPPPIENVYVFRFATVETDNPNPQFSLEQFSREEGHERRGIEEVAALPTGLILYDARLFRKLATPWFAYEFDRDHTVKQSTEDVYQTRNAAIAGMPQFCAWSCWAGHRKWKTVRRPWKWGKDQVHDSLVQATRASDEKVTILNFNHGDAS